MTVASFQGLAACILVAATYPLTLWLVCIHGITVLESKYTFFYVLYPLGVLGEMMLYFASLPVIWARGQWNYSLPNAANISFNFYYFLVITMLLYIPLFPQLYGHMIKQRRKIIGGVVTVDSSKKTN